MMGAANDLIVIFLGLEILSIALYVLAAFNHKRAESGEAALKYFVLGAFSSAIFVYGIALTYGATGSSNLPEIADYLSKNVVASNGVLLGGLALLLIGFGFKIAAVPFHMWSPDVYQGSPSPITGFMAAVAKAGAFAALLRVFVSSFGTVRADWQPVVWVLAILSLLLGALVALVQKDIKRMMAYSSINHVGFILLGVEAATTRGVSASLYYLFVYMFLTIGTFAVITVVARDGDTGNQITDYRGLAKRQPLLALCFAVLLLGQAGVPFTTGFLAKFGVVGASVVTHSYVLATVAMVSAAIAAFFYLRVTVTMYSPVGAVADPVEGEDGSVAAADGSIAEGSSASPPPTTDAVASLQILTDAPPSEWVVERGAVPVPALTWVAIGLTVGFTVVFGIIPGPILAFAHQATLLFT
jgi:NADH-quinone oxidoreductase subunit N